MILMYCIIDIQPDDLSEVSSAMLHYINHFVNYQTDNADYYWFDNTGKFAPTPPDFEMNRPPKWCS